MCHGTSWDHSTLIDRQCICDNRFMGEGEKLEEKNLMKI